MHAVGSAPKSMETILVKLVDAESGFRPVELFLQDNLQYELVGMLPVRYEDGSPK